MRWTNDAPTSPGWYWCLDSSLSINGGLPFVAQVEAGGLSARLFWTSTVYHGDSYIDEYPELQWAGPIPFPAE